MSQLSAGRRSVPIVVNPEAGSLRAGLPLPGDRLSRIEAWLESAGVTRVPASELPAAVGQLVADGASRVAVGGGDGTLAAVTPVFRGRADRELVPLPLGTHNHFCRDLGISLDPETWNDLLTSEDVRAVDVGRVNERLFLNNLSVGLYPRMIRIRRALPDERLLGSKRLASAYAALKALLGRFRPVRVYWSAPGRSGRFRSLAVLIANNAYASEPLAPLSRRRLNAGVLVMFRPERLRPSDVTAMANHALRGEVDRCPHLTVIESPSFDLAFKRSRIEVAVDGELVRLDTPLHVESLPGALRVVAPA